MLVGEVGHTGSGFMGTTIVVGSVSVIVSAGIVDRAGSVIRVGYVSAVDNIGSTKVYIACLVWVVMVAQVTWIM